MQFPLASGISSEDSTFLHKVEVINVECLLRSVVFQVIDNFVIQKNLNSSQSQRSVPMSPKVSIHTMLHQLLIGSSSCFVRTDRHTHTNTHSWGMPLKIVHPLSSALQLQLLCPVSEVADLRLIFTRRPNVADAASLTEPRPHSNRSFRGIRIHLRRQFSWRAWFARRRC